MFRTKICGVRLQSDIQAVGQFPGSAIGLNFFPPSARYVDPTSELAFQLATTAIEASLLRVGVFVNEPVTKMQSISENVGIDIVQLHGDESIETARELIEGDRRVIRAIKLPRTDLSAELIAERCGPWIEIGCHLLLDADAGAAHGGSGQVLDWTAIADWGQDNADVGWTLAGGLTPTNVAQAMAVSGAISVDTASGVESARGVKSPELIRQFCEASNG